MLLEEVKLMSGSLSSKRWRRLLAVSGASVLLAGAFPLTPTYVPAQPAEGEAPVVAEAKENSEAPAEGMPRQKMRPQRMMTPQATRF